MGVFEQEELVGEEKNDKRGAAGKAAGRGRRGAEEARFDEHEELEVFEGEPPVVRAHRRRRKDRVDVRLSVVGPRESLHQIRPRDEAVVIAVEQRECAWCE